MHAIQKVAGLAVLITAIGLRPVAAQVDYRNLDDHRPVQTEDAYPIERYAFEVQLPYGYENGPGAEEVHVVAPEISYGILANTQVGLKLPVAAVHVGGETDWGLAGPRLFGLYNFNTEGRHLPALALRTDLSLPLGGFGGDDPQVTLEGIATRGWGRMRLHFNGSVTLGDAADRPAIEAEPRWALSLAGDYTFIRQSLLLVGELGLLEAAPEEPTEAVLAFGFRYQLTPTIVFDAGVSRRLSADAGPDLGLTLGLSHAFALAGLLPGRRR
jgi:hypothetical protein